jgi:hypothetical protein
MNSVLVFLILDEVIHEWGRLNCEWRTEKVGRCRVQCKAADRVWILDLEPCIIICIESQRVYFCVSSVPSVIKYQYGGYIRYRTSPRPICGLCNPDLFEIRTMHDEYRRRCRALTCQLITITADHFLRPCFPTDPYRRAPPGKDHIKSRSRIREAALEHVPVTHPRLISFPGNRVSDCFSKHLLSPIPHAMSLPPGFWSDLLRTTSKRKSVVNIAVIGPPECGKSTFIRKAVKDLHPEALPPIRRRGYSSETLLYILYCFTRSPFLTTRSRPQTS